MEKILKILYFHQSTWRQISEMMAEILTLKAIWSLFSYILVPKLHLHLKFDWKYSFSPLKSSKKSAITEIAKTGDVRKDGIFFLQISFWFHKYLDTKHI